MHNAIWGDMMYWRIRDLREDRDLTQQKVADYLHCSQRAYSHYERGDADIPTSVLIQLAILYNTSTDYLLGVTDDFTPPKRKKREEGQVHG